MCVWEKRHNLFSPSQPHDRYCRLCRTHIQHYTEQRHFLRLPISKVLDEKKIITTPIPKLAPSPNALPSKMDSIPGLKGLLALLCLWNYPSPILGSPRREGNLIELLFSCLKIQTLHFSFSIPIGIPLICPPFTCCKHYRWSSTSPFIPSSPTHFCSVFSWGLWRSPLSLPSVQEALDGGRIVLFLFFFVGSSRGARSLLFPSLFAPFARTHTH